MTSYQQSIHRYSNFNVVDNNKNTLGAPFGTTTNRAKTARDNGDDNKGTFTTARHASRAKKTEPKKKDLVSLKKKIYSVSGTAPAPSKDFFELVVHKDEVIFRKWRIRFNKNGKGVVPSEDRMDFESFVDSDIVQGEVERNLGGDALHMALGHVTNIWLPRLPIKVLALLTSFLNLEEIANLRKVCGVFNRRLQIDTIWEFPLLRDFGIDIRENPMIKNGKIPLRKLYWQELQKRREAEIDWDNV